MRVYAQRRWTIYAHSLLSLQAHLRFSYTIVGTSRIWNQPGIQRCGQMAVIACVVTAHPLSRRFVAGCSSAIVFFFNDPTPPEIYTLSLHDALPIFPAPEGGPPATFVAAVEQGLEAAEVEARRRLSKLVAQAKDRAAAEREASLERLARWLAQSKAKPAQREKILQDERRIHDAAIAALDGARLELDQSALIQLL